MSRLTRSKSLGLSGFHSHSQGWLLPPYRKYWSPNSLRSLKKMPCAYCHVSKFIFSQHELRCGEEPTLAIQWSTGGIRNQICLHHTYANLFTFICIISYLCFYIQILVSLPWFFLQWSVESVIVVEEHWSGLRRLESSPWVCYLRTWLSDPNRIGNFLLSLSASVYIPCDEPLGAWR